jgi:hypothetical protein
VQVLLALEHTIFKIDATIDNYTQLLRFIEINFSVKKVKENILFIPMIQVHNHKRKFLMKWLFSYYKKETKNYNPQLKFELVKRIEKPIHIHFLAKENQLVTLLVTFYDDATCQLVLDSRCEKCNLFLLQYFAGYIRLKSATFNLFELSISTKKQEDRLRNFLKKDLFYTVPIKMLYNKQALEYFLDMSLKKEALSELEKAYALLKVKESDSLREIKKHYKKLAKVYHPDLSRLDIVESTANFQILSDAFSIIKRYKTAA